MAASLIYEGDTIILYSPESNGFVYSQTPSSSFSHVTIFPVPVAHIKDPAFPSVHFASFQVLPENSNLDLSSYSPLAAGNLASKNSQPRALVYGRKIKLLHVASKKYVSIKSSDKAGSKNPVAQLVDKDDINCLFRILHSRVGKQRGEDVNSEDSIKLECVCKKSHHLLSTLNTISTRYELKMAVTDSIFTIYSQTTSDRKTFNRSMMRGSDVMMIFSVKKEAYLSGRGSIATEFLPDAIREDKIIKEVGGRARQAFHGIQKSPPISGDCFWQVERIDNPLSNNVFHFNDKCRLKHLPTQQYLAVELMGHTHQLTLKQLTDSLRNDPHQVTFSLISATKEVTGCIQKDSYVELRHIGTGKNLTTSDTPQPLKKWYKLVLEDSDETKKQYFKMEEVNEDLIHDYYHVSGVVAILKEYIQKFTSVEKPVPFPPPLEELNEVLCNTADWIRTSTDNQKSRANMLRVAEAVDLLVGFLHEITDFNDNNKTLCQCVCKVLKQYVKGSNRKSHMYLSEKRLMDTLFSKIGNNIGVEKVLSTLVRYESDLTEGIVTRLTTDSAHTKHILEKLDKNTLDFLGSLCFTAGKPLQHLQNIMINYVIKVDQSKLFKTTVVNGEVHFTHPENLVGSIKTICSKSNSSKAKDLFDFFVSQLKFFSRVCKGVNFTAINIITEELEYVSLEQALICVKDPELHPLLRSVYLDFVISAFVDHNVEESGTDIDNIWRSFDWDRINSNPKKTTGLRIDFDDIPNTNEIKDLQRDHLGKCKKLYAEENVEGGGQNELLTVMLSALEPLVSYGFYWKPDEILTIIEILIDILDVSCDKLSDPKDVTTNQKEDKSNKKREKDKSKEKNRRVFKVITKAVKVLHLFFKQLSYLSLAKLIYDFKSLACKVTLSSQDAYTPINEDLVVLVKDDFELNEKLITSARERLRFYFKEYAYSFFDYSKENGKKLIKILMDLMKYENDELKLSSTKLLFDIFQAEKILFNDAKKSYIVVTDVSKIANYKMMATGTLSDNDKILLRLMQGKGISGDVNKLLVTHLNYVSEVCTVDKDETVPNYSTQWIAYSCGVFQALLTYVLSFSLTENEKQKELLDLTCHTLCRIINGNPQIQVKLFLSFVDLIESKTAVRSVAQMLTQTFTGNIALCRKLSEADIRLVFQAANSGGIEYNEYYVTLEAIIKVSKSNPVFLKKHQDIVSHILSESIPDYFSSFLLSDKANERLKLLTEFDNDKQELVQLLCVTDLLATCAEGQCKFVEYTCQGIFTLDELLTILENRQIAYQRKKPFARILNRAYLNTERDSKTTLSTVWKRKEFWTHIEEVSGYINSLWHKIQEDNIETDGLKKILRILFSKHMSLQAWLECSKEINVPVPLKPKESVESSAGTDKTSQDAIPMNSLLIYICDGLVPFISSFCTQLMKLTSKVYPSLLTPNVISALTSIGESIAQILLQLPKIFATTETQVNLFSGCLKSLVSVLPSDHTEIINQAIENVKSLRKLLFHTPAELDHISGELSRNDSFRTFVKHFETTYDGVTKSKEGNEVRTSFQNLIDVFSPNEKLEKVKILLRLLDILYRQLQHPLTGGERAEYDSMLLTALQVMSGIVLTRIDDIDQSLQSKDPEKFEMEYISKVLPIQDRLVEMKSCDKVMNHLSHPDDEVAVHALGFLSVVLYLGNAEAQKNIGHLTVHHNTKFFIRISQILEGVISCLGRPVLNVPCSSKVEAKKQPPPTDQELETSSKDSRSHIAVRGLEEEPSDATLLVHKPAAEGDIELDNMMQDKSEGGSEGDEEDTDLQVNSATVKDEELTTEEESEDYDFDFDFYFDADFDYEYDTDEDEEDDNEDEADYGENVKPIARKYNVLGTGQLETSTDDALKRASIVLDVVSWLCDGQNREMQQTLRQQRFAFFNVNIVSEIAVVLQTLAEHLSLKNMIITKKAIQALIEMCTGNYPNKETAIKGQIIDSVNTMLQMNFRKPTEEELTQVLEVRASAIELLEVMLEETHENSCLLAQEISDDLSVTTLLHVMLDITKLGEPDEVQKLGEPDEVQKLGEPDEVQKLGEPDEVQKLGETDEVQKLGETDKVQKLGETDEELKIKAERAVFRAYHVLKRIATDYLDQQLDDYVESKSPKFLMKYPKAKDMWVHLSNHSRSIEVNYVTKENKKILTRIYFSFDPSKELSEEDKDIVKENIVRESRDDKVKDLLKWMESIRKNIRHKKFIHSKLWLMWAVILSGPRHIALMILTLLLNLMVLFLFEVPEDLMFPTDNLSNSTVILINDPDIPVWFSSYAVYILGGLHLILGLWMTIEYFVLEAKNILVSFPLLEKLIWDLKKWRNRHKKIASKLNQLFCGMSKQTEDDIKDKKPEDAKCFEVYLFSFSPLYRLLFVVCSILSLASHGYFYCGCILYLFLKSSVLHQVLTAVRRSALQLIVVGLLGLAVLLIYAVISFAILYNFFDPDGDSNLFCDTLWQCFVTVTREGLLDTLGATLPVRTVGQELPDFTVYAVRTIFDLSFFIIITTLGLNIVVAILVDRFSELRSEKDKIMKDKLNSCFVCGIDNDMFKAKGYRHHVQNDHSKWNYIYFYLHLDSLCTNDHNALEKYVYDNIKGGKIGFFPLKAKVLESHSQ